MNFIWIIIGIIYVLYKLSQENKSLIFQIILLILGFAILAAPLAIVESYADSHTGKQRIAAYNVSIGIWIFYFALFVFICIWQNRDEFKRKRDVRNLLIANGFDVRDARIIKKCIQSPLCDVENALVLAGYISRNGLDKARQNELESKTDDELSTLLGYPLKDIPFDDERTLYFITPWQRRRRYAIAYIMSKEELIHDMMPLQTDGGIAFVSFVEEHTNYTP